MLKSYPAGKSRHLKDKTERPRQNFEIIYERPEGILSSLFSQKTPTEKWIATLKEMKINLVELREKELAGAAITNNNNLGPRF